VSIFLFVFLSSNFLPRLSLYLSCETRAGLERRDEYTGDREGEIVQKKIETRDRQRVEG